jgi:transcriptional regulator of nitric oxide reductase
MACSRWRPEAAALLARALFWLMLMALAWPATAGVMTRDALARRFPSPLMVGGKDAALPVWPLFRQNATATELVGYAFESIDFAPVPGFAGVPINLLVAIDPKGNFLEVQVLSHHEPVFLEGLGEAPMFRFAQQCRRWHSGGMRWAKS